MGFESIKQKSASMGKKPMSAFLKVNKYENPQAALDLISHICTAGMDLAVQSEFVPYRDKYQNMEEDYAKYTKYEDYENGIVNDSMDDLQDKFNLPFAKMPGYLQHSGFSDAVSIAVGGGYSSGKSSFLNNITGMGAVLPTGIEPVSMINTYISFSDTVKKLVVSGENCKGHIVKLDCEVLDCIQHSSKSKVYVSSVLNELYVRLPIEKGREFLKDIVFTDTPGYNNSDNANKENGKTDSDTALEALKASDALFWCIDIEAGTISQRDLDMLNELVSYEEENKCDYPFVIVFNKIDKKPENDVVKILQAADKVCRAKLKQQPLDIIAYSSIGESSVYSLNSKKKASTKDGVMKVLSSLFNRMSKKIANHRTVAYWTNELASYFETEIADCDKNLVDLEDKRKELAKKKAEAFSNSTNSDDENMTFGDYLPIIEDVMITSYDDVVNSRDGVMDLYKRAMNGWQKALDREKQWAKECGFFSDTSNLQRLSDNAKKECKRIAKAADKNCEEFQFCGTESRKGNLEVVEMAFDFWDKNHVDDESNQDSLKEEYDNIVLSKKIISEYKSFLQKKKPEVVTVFTACCQNAIKKNEKRLRALQNIKDETETDVFSAIANDNMSRFLDCFSTGVDMTKCNSQGFSPLTYVAKNSNNAMMKFLIAHDADLSMKDKNGYNALETAAIYHCQDICELLIHVDKGLVFESQPLAKLADNDRFEKWISNF